MINDDLRIGGCRALADRLRATAEKREERIERILRKLPDIASVRSVCAAVSKPFNFMVGLKGKSFSVSELAAAGVRRISLATSLYRVAMTGLIDAVSYLRVGRVFVANMTGNVVFLGFADIQQMRRRLFPKTFLQFLGGDVALLGQDPLRRDLAGVDGRGHVMASFVSGHQIPHLRGQVPPGGEPRLGRVPMGGDQPGPAPAARIRGRPR